MGIKRVPPHIQALIDGQAPLRPPQRLSVARRSLRQPEADFQATVLEYAALRGWRHYHDVATNAPRRCADCGSFRRLPRNAPGWPDLVLVRRPRLLFVELKREGEKPEPEQVAWLEELKACGQQVYVWTPAQWPEIERLLR
jgi:hypothetical protein